ncbi:hypothetical protein IWZ00DRAFT_167774 [Phyllosticta capitalensis]|uniref:Glycosyltransferase family 25 protein n=1 Tax=Phyllosticta capitalensis TaxID=121624 RepID=A0ABR1YYS5_9PEZI
MLPCTHSRRSSGLISFVLVAVIFFVLWKQPGPDTVKSISNFSPSSLAPSKLLESIGAGKKQPGGTENATLGFEAIFAVSPWASWRSDGLVFAANRTNLTIAIPPQVPPSQPEVNAFMANSLSGTLNEGSARAWLGHLQVLHAARNGNYSSVLILEDDADWDVEIHDQAKMVASAVRNLSTPANATAAPGWPWGNHWDILWLGHCGERLPFPEEIDEPEPPTATPGAGATDEEEDDLYSGRIHSAWEIPKRRKLVGAKRKHDPFTDDYVLLNDSTLPAFVTSYDQRLSNTPNTRWVQYAAGPICTFAYAVNARSIARILDEFKMGAEQAWDMWMHTRCRAHELRCFSVNPELFHHHVPAASQDLQHSLVNVNLQGEGTHNYTANIRYSARCNWDKSDDELISCMEA